jgi:hypothetical protein
VVAQHHQDGDEQDDAERGPDQLDGRVLAGVLLFTCSAARSSRWITDSPSPVSSATAGSSSGSA